jgi:hypothetical protein
VQLKSVEVMTRRSPHVEITTKEKTRMKRLAFAAIFAVASLFTIGADPAAAQGGRNIAGVAIPVAGAGPSSTFTGTFTLQRFVATETGVAAVGQLVGTLTDTSGTVPVVRSIVQTVTAALPAGAIEETACDILSLNLGPLHLDLLGLVVDLNEIVLNITAQPGPGNLLGNLLCSVAGLLDNPGGLARLLNQILGVLSA